ncbi:MAG: endopeptidase La, partial [Thermoplasmata archaeon]|nr:endopeptidase La [Thermoplasmata archaeon]
EFPVIALRDTIIFPSQILPILVARPKSVIALEKAMVENRAVVFVAQKSKDHDDPKPEELYKIGCLTRIQQINKQPNNNIQILAEGISRVKILKYTEEKASLRALVSEITEEVVDNTEVEGLMRSVLAQFKQILEVGKAAPPFDALIALFNLKNPNRLADLCVANLEIGLKDKQQVLETIEITKRLSKVNSILTREIKVMQVGRKIQGEAEKELNKMQREIILREQMKAIQKELGGDEENEFKDIEKKIEAAGMPEEIKAKAQKELGRLTKMPAFSPEIPYVRTYLDWLVELPWKKNEDGEKIEMKKAKKILEEEHYGLNKVKERIIEYLAVHKLTGKARGPILCFVGPPGTGKTSIGKSIARSMGRKFVRMSLGGIRDEAEIRGHRRTYVGALPGRIIQGIKNAGSKNAVFMLDEIDKVGTDFRGDPSSALLEALDPEQNFSFSDHYLEVPFDLSEVMFVTTANMVDTIPSPLLDRMEIIPFPGYTEEEKAHIAKKYLIKKQIEANGLKKFKIRFDDKAVSMIVSQYTKEAGVRELERQIAAICRKLAREIAEGKKDKHQIGEKEVAKYLGAPKYRPVLREKQDEIGLVTGLAVTEAGGEVLFVESTLMPGKGHLILTGHLGQVMKESAQAAVSFARTIAKKFEIKDNFYEKNDIHIHVPAGAIPK